MRGVPMAKSEDGILSWSQFWAYFTRPDLDHKLKVDMARDLRMEQFLDGISAEAQIEVLQDAPVSVVRSLQKHLKTKAKIALKDMLEPPHQVLTLDNITKEQARLAVRRTFG